MEWQIQPDAEMSHVCQQCLYENCQQVVEKEQWPPNNCANLNAMEISCVGTHEAIFKLSSEVENSF